MSPRELPPIAFASETPPKAFSARDSAYRRDLRALIAWVGVTLGTVAVGAAGFAHGKLWDHDAAIKVLEAKAGAQEKRLDSIDQKLDRILDELRRRQ